MVPLKWTSAGVHAVAARPRAAMRGPARPVIHVEIGHFSTVSQWGVQAGDVLGPLGHCAPILGTVRHDGMACKKRASIVAMWRMMVNGHFHAATSVPSETDAPHGACVHPMTRAGPGGSPPDHMGGQDSTPLASTAHTRLSTMARVSKKIKLLLRGCKAA